MKNILVADAFIIAIAAPASAQMTSSGLSSIHGTRDQGAASGTSLSSNYASSYGAENGVDGTTTYSIAPNSDIGLSNGQGESRPMSEDTNENYSRAVGGRAD